MGKGPSLKGGVTVGGGVAVGGEDVEVGVTVSGAALTKCGTEGTSVAVRTTVRGKGGAMQLAKMHNGSKVTPSHQRSRNLCPVMLTLLLAGLIVSDVLECRQLPLIGAGAIGRKEIVTFLDDLAGAILHPE